MTDVIVAEPVADNDIADEPKRSSDGGSIPTLSARSHVKYFIQQKNANGRAGAGEIRCGDSAENTCMDEELVTDDPQLVTDNPDDAKKESSVASAPEPGCAVARNPQDEETRDTIDVDVEARGSQATVSTTMATNMSTAPMQLDPTKDNISDDPAATADRDKEFRKSVIVSILVVLFWSFILGIFALGQSKYEEPVCTEIWAREVEAPKICEVCGNGTLVLPLFSNFERSLPKPLLASLYFVGLLWVFLGIGIVCDQFMGAIEEITSKEFVRWIRVCEGAKHKFHIKIWNPTVANLTLMALGSSAPEILLNVLEVCGGGYFAGELGPSTIVGSAAFNLLVITAVCISSIPGGQLRKIDNLDVFAVTAGMSVFAYAWVVVILQLSSPDRVEPWEAIVTFLFFPLLTAIAYAADRGVFSRICQTCGCKGEDKSISELDAVRLRSQYGNVIPMEAFELLAAQQACQKPAVLTKAKVRQLMGISNAFKKFGVSVGADSQQLTVGFENDRHVVFENAGTLSMKIVCSRPPGISLTVRYCTSDGTAQEGLRYKKAEGEIIFGPLQTEVMIGVDMIDNDTYEEAMDFYVDITDVQGFVNGAWISRPDMAAMAHPVALWRSRAVVTVLNDDMPGTIGFDCDEVHVAPTAVNTRLGITRRDGHHGDITCRYRTVDGTAISGKDFVPCDAFLEFADGETYQTIDIEMIPSPIRVSMFDESFKVVLDDATEGVKFDVSTDGGGECSMCEIILTGSTKPCLADRLVHPCYNKDKFRKNLDDWVDQFRGALYCNGDFCEQSDAGLVDWLFHALSFNWKLLFAFVPPPGFLGGWFCFCVALGMIGFVTAIVGDMAGLLGCCIDIPDDITAITLVALGTSLPDTFASKVAAQQNPNADDSVGNVTGSNCVNVFLGLGMPWSIGALYWEFIGRNDVWDDHLYKGQSFKELYGGTYPGGGFIVPAGSLVFSVTVFTCCAIACIMLLMVRRLKYGGELGGPASACRRDSSILVLLWIIYVVASIVNSVLAG